MRHNVSGRKLNRTAAHRKMLYRNLVTALFRHERIETTEAKAKELRKVADRLIEQMIVDLQDNAPKTNGTSDRR